MPSTRRTLRVHPKPVTAEEISAQRARVVDAEKRNPIDLDPPDEFVERMAASSDRVGEFLRDQA